MTKLKKGKRSASKRQKRKLLKKHKEDPSKLAEYSHNKMMEKVLPEWQNQIISEEEYEATLSKRERKFRAVQKVLGIVKDVKAAIPIPAVVNSNRDRIYNDIEQENYEKKRNKNERLENKEALEKNVENDKMEDIESNENEDKLFDLWANDKVKNKSKQQYSIESAGRILATVIPHPGQSYNPDVTEYQKALSKAGRVEARKVLKEQRIEKRLNADSNDPNVLSGGHDALDGLNIQKRALENEAKLPEEIILEKQMLQEELKRMKEISSKPKPLIPNSQIRGRKIHRIQLSKKERKVRERYHKDETITEKLNQVEQMKKLEEEKFAGKKSSKRRHKELEIQKIYDSISDAKDILLPEEMPTRMSSMGQNLPSYIASQVKLIKGKNSKLM